MSPMSEKQALGTVQVGNVAGVSFAYLITARRRGDLHRAGDLPVEYKKRVSQGLYVGSSKRV